MRVVAGVATLAVLLLLASPPGAQTTGPKVTAGHGLSMYGDLKYPAGFKHFQYVNPEAPKGGDVKLAVIGSFDTLNPFVIRGVPAPGIGGIFDSLTVESQDEPFSQYGLIAETIEVPADRSWVAFTLRPQARFHDGSPDHGRGRDLDVRDPQGEGPALLPELLRPGHEGREGRRAQGPLHVRPRGQPGAAADRGPAPRAVARLLEPARLREDHARAAARQRRLPGRGRRPRAIHHLPPREGLLGRPGCR